MILNNMQIVYVFQEEISWRMHYPLDDPLGYFGIQCSTLGLCYSYCIVVASSVCKKPFPANSDPTVAFVECSPKWDV